jgi:hypothetical protein
MSYENIKIKILDELIDIKDFPNISELFTDYEISYLLSKIKSPSLDFLLTNDDILTLKAKISAYDQFMKTSLIKELFNHKWHLNNETNITENFFNRILVNGIRVVYDNFPYRRIAYKFIPSYKFYGTYMEFDIYHGLGKYKEEIELLNNFLKPLNGINTELFITIKDDFHISPYYPLTKSRIVKFLGFLTSYEKCFIYDPIIKTLTVKSIIRAQQPVYMHEGEWVNL